MRELIKLTCLCLGVSLLIITGLLDTVRQPDSAAYWLLMRQRVGQTNQFNYFLASPNGQVKKALLPSVSDNYNWYLAWSSDGQYIFYRINFVTPETRQAGVFRLDIYSGETDLLIEDELGYEATGLMPSPNKKWFALAIPDNEGQDLFVLSADTRHIEALPEISFSQIYWSHDSQSIYYVDFFDGEFRQFKLNVQSQEKMVVDWEEPFYRYSSDQTAYAFFDDEQRDAWYVNDLATKKTTRLTPDDNGRYFVLGWLSHDWLLVVKNTSGHVDAMKLYRARADGTEWELLYEIESKSQPIYLPFWDENAEWVYFDSFTDDDQHQIERFHIDTLEHQLIISNLKPLGPNIDYLSSYQGEPSHVRWVRREGTLIWWQPIDEIPAHFELRQIQADGTNERVLFKADDYYETFDMQISPDNQWAYLNLTDLTRGGERTQIWRVNLRHRQQEQIFDDNTELVSISPAVEMDYSAQKLKWGGIGFILASLGFYFVRVKASARSIRRS